MDEDAFCIGAIGFPSRRDGAEVVLLHGAEARLEPLHQPVSLAARGDKTFGGAAVGVQEKVGVDEVRVARIGLGF